MRKGEAQRSLHGLLTEFCDAIPILCIDHICSRDKAACTGKNMVIREIFRQIAHQDAARRQELDARERRCEEIDCAQAAKRLCGKDFQNLQAGGNTLLDLRRV